MIDVNFPEYDPDENEDDRFEDKNYWNNRVSNLSKVDIKKIIDESVSV